MPMPIQPQGMMPPPNAMGGPPPQGMAMPMPPEAMGAAPAPAGGGPMQGPPPAEAEDEGLDFEQTMADLTMAGLSQLDDVDFKALSKLSPDLSWVLSKIYGTPAIEVLRKAGASQRKGFVGGAPQSAGPAQAGTPQALV